MCNDDLNAVGDDYKRQCIVVQGLVQVINENLKNVDLTPPILEKIKSGRGFTFVPVEGLKEKIGE